MSVTPKNLDTSPSSSQDPVKAMAEILKDSELSAEDKQLLYDLARTRFKHRRSMAYISLFAMIGFGIANVLSNAEFDIAWINGTFAAIVGAYFGLSAFKPGS